MLHLLYSYWMGYGKRKKLQLWCTEIHKTTGPRLRDTASWPTLTAGANSRNLGPEPVILRSSVCTAFLHQGSCPKMYVMLD